MLTYILAVTSPFYLAVIGIGIGENIHNGLLAMGLGYVGFILGYFIYLFAIDYSFGTVGRIVERRLDNLYKLLPDFGRRKVLTVVEIPTSYAKKKERSYTVKKGSSYVKKSGLRCNGKAGCVC